MSDRPYQRRVIGVHDSTTTDTTVTIEAARQIVMRALDGFRAVKPEQQNQRTSSRSLRRS